ncbi:nucleotidyltransferase domain-containing protein [Streptomyces sp. NPDC005820]|uniref:nucleotidyltransferase domain-containing protein n=1 Tax=Streptomyces sp. NPDC005820 TaxID=3157069 RepID=UPI0033D3B85C
MREYGFVRTPRAVYRLFGRHHPPGKALLLLRYHHSAGRWHKPGVFEAEVMSGAVLDLYDVPLYPVHHYGIALGVAPLDSDTFTEYFDPLTAARGSAVRTLCLAAGLPEGMVGVTGSRLVGLAHRNSDLDLVVYGPNGPAAGAELLRTSSLSQDRAAEMSSTMRRMRSLNGIPVPRETERNIFKGVIRDGDLPRKLDLHYAESDEDATSLPLPASIPVAERHLRQVTVVDAGRRHLFPGHLECRTADGRACRMGINDHVLSLLLPGDRFSALCTEVRGESDDVARYVARTVTEVALR